MKCYHCGQEIQDGAEFCTYCGASQGAGATVVLDQAFNPYAADVQTTKTDELTTLLNQTPYAAVPQTQYAASGAPAIQFATNRSLWKMILFGILTLGIYNIVIWCKAVTELNVAACRYDGQRTMPLFAMCNLAGITLGIYPLVWYHNFTARMGNEARRRGFDCNLSAATFWLWNVLGALILVGPFVYQHKMLKALNMINSHFNVNG